MTSKGLPILKSLTLDITGTILKYKLHIGDIYCISAKKVGQECPDYDRMYKGYNEAYTIMGKEYPCFGSLENPKMPIKEWWRKCVYKSFVIAGYDYDENSLIFDRIFNRIYALFGSREPYEVFDDVKLFMNYIQSIKPKVNLGVITNASERYRDTILPIMDLEHYFDFVVTATDAKSKKPSLDIFNYTKQYYNIQFNDTWLHIGDNKLKDYDPIIKLGGNSILLNRFNSSELEEYKNNNNNIPIMDNLNQVIEYCKCNYQNCL